MWQTTHGCTAKADFEEMIEDLDDEDWLDMPDMGNASGSVEVPL